MPETALIIGPIAHCRRMEQQLALLSAPPIVIGWVVHDEADAARAAARGTKAGSPILGTLDELEAIIARRSTTVALVTMPAVMKDLIAATRTRLRRLGVADRFMPTLEDLVAGVGPRTHIDVDVAALLDRPPKVMDADAVREVIDGRRILITGAGGSIGSELARSVSGFEPEQVLLMERSENALFEIDRQLARTRPNLPRKAILHDVVDEAGTLAWFRQFEPEIIFHTAAHKHVPMMEDHPSAAVDNNLFGTKSVADAAHAIGADRFVLISSDKAVNPVSIMGTTKRLAELYVQHLNGRSTTGFSIVRFGNVLASSGSVLEIWSRQIADGGPLTVTDPRMTRYFMTIPEAAALVIQSAALLDQTESAGEVFLLDMGEPVRIVDLAERFVRQHGLEPVCVADSEAGEGRPGKMPIVFTGIRPGERLYEELSFNAESMRPTRHPDINIWTLPPPCSRYVTMMIESLHPVRRPSDSAALAERIRRLVVDQVAMAAA